MKEFEKVIGYESIKNELIQICDMIKNRERYEKLGAKLPTGVLLYGRPGRGKTLLSKCLIEASGLPTFVLRKNQGSDQFVKTISQTFKDALSSAPSIVFLDDMDKFANEDEKHPDAVEYVAIQSGIDDAAGSGVFVVATANDIDKLPDSLLRSGRFDRKIQVRCPSEADSDKIIRHFFETKRVADDINFEDVAKMISYSSCADLETIINEAAITAGFAKHDCITMEDIVQSVLRMQYDSPDVYTKKPREKLKEIALHEAGHLVISEVLDPGSVGIASIRRSGRSDSGGFIRVCREHETRRHNILISLGGKAAVELYYSETCASGCYRDIKKAFWDIREGLCESGTRGFGMIDVASVGLNTSANFIERNEAVVQAELERCIFKARDILLKNREFLEKVAEALVEKETLLYSDIRAIRESVKIEEVAI